ncbi:hypothetical protein O6H91_05G077000 [Diphasiastrum complanatum]|uniref:Uncharacterized protein n=1 Tax=Diphasiastrum complanatum TaxID=34168 RepID=A0ACC2DPP1_DIPCM|nr:hypothetical protein O6H91_05G077000 [Diphasiastrum complanatum]
MIRSEEDEMGLELIEPSRRSSSLFAYEKVVVPDRHEKWPLISEAGWVKAPKPPRVPFQQRRNVKLLGTIQLGPFGFEETVRAGGPVLMLVGLLLYPILWSIPLAMMTAELSCMIPESGGHVLWVYRAFGPFWSFLTGFFAFASSVLDNALYPALFVDYLSAIFYEGNHSISYGWSVVIKISLVVLVTIINILGIDIVGTAAIILGVAVLSPFFAMIVLGLPHLDFGWTEQPAPSAINWGKFITLLLWNTSGFDVAGTCAAEVRNPGRSYPRALAASVILILAAYGLPTIIGVSVIPNYKLWQDGTYMIAAKLIGGHSLKVWMGISEVISALGLLLTRLCTNSRILYGMALVEQVPSVFSWLHPRFATPWTSVLLTSLCTLLLLGFSSYSLAEADMLFYALSTVLKFSALVQLRFTEPDAFRPFRIPVDPRVLAALTVIPIGLCISMIYFASDHSQAIGLIGAVVAIFTYMLKELVSQFGTQAEEVVQYRMMRVQKNIDKMQQRIDSVIEKEFKAPLEHFGQAFQKASSEHPVLHIDEHDEEVTESQEENKLLDHPPRYGIVIQDGFEDSSQASQKAKLHPLATMTKSSA